MYNCIACSNCFKDTKKTRPNLTYHRFPSNTYMKKKWLKVYGISQINLLHRVCSDHFLKENYQKGKKRILIKNSIPQPYDQNRNENGFLDNSTTQSNDMQVDNNTILQVEHNHLSDNIPSIRSTLNGYMLRVQIEQFNKQIPANDNNQTIITSNIEPVTTTIKDHALGNGIRCSIKNCLKRSSKDIRFYTFPRNLAMRKKWIAKCGLDIDPTENPKRSLQICHTHFTDSCFLNSGKMMRLKAYAIPSLFLDDDIIDARNIPSTSSHVDKGFADVNKTSCLSPNYNANVDITPLLEYIDSTEDFEPCCSILECTTNDTVEDVKNPSLFRPTMENVNEWSLILGMQLTVNTYVCEKHFSPQDMLIHELLENGLKGTFKQLVPNALPVPIDAMQSASNVRNNVLDNTDKCSIDDFPTIEIDVRHRLKKLSSNNSLSITLKPIKHSEVMEPSAKTSMSLESKFKHKLPSTTNNSLSISPTSRYISYELPEKSTTSKPFSLVNSGSQCIITVDSPTKDFIVEDYGFIFELSKIVPYPSLFWKSEHVKARNETHFYQRDNFEKIVKKIHFYNSLVPIIIIYDKKYEFNVPIEAKSELKILLEIIDSIDKCSSMDEKCVGNFEVSYLRLRNQIKINDKINSPSNLSLP